MQEQQVRLCTCSFAVTVSIAASDGSFQCEAARLDRDCPLPADIYTLSALDTLMVSHTSHIHLTAAHTGTAVITQACIHPDADHIKPVEQSVDCSQRTEETAE